MKTLRSLVAILLCVILVAGLAGCNEKADLHTIPSSTEAEDTRPSETAPHEDNQPQEEDEPNEDDEVDQPQEEDEPQKDTSSVGKYDYLEKSILLKAEKLNLLDIAHNQVKLTVQIPEDWQPEDLEIYCNNEKLPSVIRKEELIPLNQKSVITGNTYAQYECTLNTQPLTESTNYVFLRMGEQRSNAVGFFRPLELTDEQLDVTCNALWELSEIANGITEADEPTTELYFEKAMAYLKASKDVVSTEKKGNTIFFTLTNGMTSFFTAEEVTDQLSTSLGEQTAAEASRTQTDSAPDSGQTDANSYSEAPVTVNGSCSYQDYFVKNQNPAEYISTLNPNILVMAPIRTAENKDVILNYSAANGTAEEYFGKELQARLEKGKMDLKVDGACNTQTIMDWDKYGAVLLNTHGPNDGGLVERKGGDKPATYFIMAENVAINLRREAALREFRSMAKNWQIPEDGVIDGKNRWYMDTENLGITVNFGNTDIWGNKVMGTVLLTSDYIMYLLNDAEFENTVFLFDVCNGLSDKEFNNFLLSRGAACVWGYTEAINGHTSKTLVKESATQYFLFTQEKTDHSAMFSVHGTPQYIHTILDEFYLICETNNPFTFFGYTELHGTVADKLAEIPVEKVNITLYRYYDKKLYQYRSAQTDALGQYKFEMVPFGVYMIEARHGDEHVFINFSVGSMDKKEVNIPVTEFIPIYDVEDLKAIANKPDGKYLLMNDIALPADYRSEAGVFKGIFEGGNHTISNISAPVFQEINDGEVRNLKLEAGEAVDAVPYLKEQVDYGLLARKCGFSVIYNCHAAGTVVAECPKDVGGSIGGFAGYLNRTSMDSCTSAVDIRFSIVNKTSFVGGMAAYVSESQLYNCHNTATLSLTTKTNEQYITSALYLRIGGLVGYGKCDMEYCSNTGAVSASGGSFVGTRAGGLMGEGDGLIINSWNSGAIHSYMPTEDTLDQITSVMQGTTTTGGKEEADALRKGIDNINFTFWYTPASGGCAGGLIGSANGITLQDCYNNGTVNGSYSSGGIAGRASYLACKNVVNLGEVTGSFSSGGFVGAWYYNNSASKLQSCYALGPVSATHICGPFYGTLFNKKVVVEGSCGYAGSDKGQAVAVKEAPAIPSVEGVATVLANPSFDFDTIWEYDAEGSLTINPRSPSEAP